MWLLVQYNLRMDPIINKYYEHAKAKITIFPKLSAQDSDLNPQHFQSLCSFYPSHPAKQYPLFSRVNELIISLWEVEITFNASTMNIVDHIGHRTVMIMTSNLLSIYDTNQPTCSMLVNYI